MNTLVLKMWSGDPFVVSRKSRGINTTKVKQKKFCRLMPSAPSRQDSTLSEADASNLIRAVIKELKAKTEEDPLVVAVKGALGRDTLPGNPGFSNTQYLRTPKLWPVLLSTSPYRRSDILGRFKSDGVLVVSFREHLARGFSVPVSDPDVVTVVGSFKITALQLLLMDDGLSASEFMHALEETFIAAEKAMRSLIAASLPGENAQVYQDLAEMGKEKFPLNEEWIASKLSKRPRTGPPDEDADTPARKKARGLVCKRCHKVVEGQKMTEHRNSPDCAPKFGPKRQ
jgi:hypothetical protein